MYTKFEFLTFMEFDGDFTAAAQALREQGTDKALLGFLASTPLRVDRVDEDPGVGDNDRRFAPVLVRQRVAVVCTQSV